MSSDSVTQESSNNGEGKNTSSSLPPQQQRKTSIKKKPTRIPGRQSVAKQHKSFVYVRVRPFLSIAKSTHEDGKEEKHDMDDLIPLQNLTLTTKVKSSSSGESNDVVAAMTGSLPITGFNGIFGTDSNNDFIFQTSFMPKIDTIMKGGTSSFFCYGYTSAGKSYTTLGPEKSHANYGTENGVFRLAAEEIFHRITALNEEQHKSSLSSTGEKKEPYLITASVIEVYNDDVYDLLAEKAKCTLRKNKRGQLLVRGATEKRELTPEEAEKNGFDFSVITKTLSSTHIQSVQDLDYIQNVVHSYRKVGESSEHSESSRSHAIFRLDIVNQSLLDAMKELEEAEQIKPAVQTAYDKKRTYQLRHRVLDIEKKIEEQAKIIDDLYLQEGSKHTPFGGRLILADLAGADSDNRSIGENGHTIEQRKESTAINKSLLALKECISALSSSKPIRAVPFRNSSLTRLLEEVLTPREKRDSNSVMIVNIGPEADLKSKTVNSLRYGAMFSSAKASSTARSSVARTSRSRSRTRQSLMEAKMRMKKEMEQSKKDDEE